MYFVLDAPRSRMSGRWVGLGYDGEIMTGWATMGQTQEGAEETVGELLQGAGAAWQPGTGPS
jgi:hypothetical protein